MNILPTRRQVLQAAVAGAVSPEPKRSSTIRYINPAIPKVSGPDYRGQSYEALSPDTLDLQEMAKLTINCLTETTDPEADYEIYWWVIFNSNPPMMRHDESDVVQAKFMEALPLLRLVSGSSQNPHVEQRWMEVMRQMQGPDGLLYYPKIGRPWYRAATGPQNPDEDLYGAPGDHYASPVMIGRMLGAMTVYHLLTGDESWKAAGARVADGLRKLAVLDGRKAKFAWHTYGTGGRYIARDPKSAVHNPATYASWAIQGLVNYYRFTRYEPALELAAGLARWVMEDCEQFDRNGRFLYNFPDFRMIHFHGHTMILLSLLDYGLAAGDRQAIEFARRGFEYALTKGELNLGYFPEWVDLDAPCNLETCEVADMIALALKLSRNGAGDYWDHAEAWLRNLFAEAQLRRADWVYWLGKRSAPSVVPPHYSTERVVERNLGGFGGMMAPNDFFPPRSPHERGYRDAGIMHCCTGNAARTLYYAWKNAISFENGRLAVNLLVNRASAHADVDSHIPYAGRVDVKMKQAADLSIRVPGWVKPEEVAVTVNGKTRPAAFSGRFAGVGAVATNDSVSLGFPLRETTKNVSIEKRIYTILLRGNTCVAIDPPGVNCPLFQRDHYREPVTRWRKVTRFVSDQAPAW